MKKPNNKVIRFFGCALKKAKFNLVKHMPHVDSTKRKKNLSTHTHIYNMHVEINMIFTFVRSFMPKYGDELRWLMCVCVVRLLQLNCIFYIQMCIHLAGGVLARELYMFYVGER